MNRKKHTMLAVLKEIAATLEDCAMDKDFLKKEIAKKSEYRQLSNYLGTESVEETAIFIAIFKNSYVSEEVNLEAVAKFFGLDAFDMLDYIMFFDSLENKKLIESDGGNQRYRGRYSNSNSKEYSVVKTVNDCILHDQPIMVENKDVELDEMEFVSEIDEIIRNNDMPGFLESDVLDDMTKLEKKCTNKQFIRNITNLLPNDLDARAFYYALANDLVTDQHHGINIVEFLSNLCHNRRVRMQSIRDFKNETHILIKQELVEINKADTFEDSEAILTDKGIELFLGVDAAKDFIDRKDVKARDLIDPKDITYKELFFDADTQKVYSRLINSLQEGNYQILKEGLKERNLPSGVAVLLHGFPGTGKTEMVYQLAKATGRKIMFVDISATKNCYFGESEKIIRKVFNRYRMFCNECKIKPILMFNEADAVFSKRKNVDMGNITQTENAIQNIILEEMEKLDGILIATTNMVDNLDSAFSRRFLFKVRFNLPTLEAKTKIWKSKMERLTDDEAKTLASYDFSGGEIDNIVRKVAIDELLDGNRKVPLNEIIEYCESERMNRNRTSMGFKN